jgi:hypothetical protein
VPTNPIHEQVTLVSDTPDVYQPEERLIFHYYAGEAKGIVHADPMVLYKRFMSVRGDFNGDYSVAFSSSKGAPAAHDALMCKIRMIFDLPASFQDGGLTEGECLELIQFYWAWCEKTKKNSRSSPTSPDATPDSSAPPTEECPPTPSTSDSGSTCPENTTAAPGPS